MKLSKYRYLELKYFSLQYPELKEKLKAEISRVGILEKQGEWSDPTGDAARKIAELKNYIFMIEDCARQCDREIGAFILTAVTLGLSFNIMKSRYSLPCERDMYYDRRRKYFELLDIFR